MAEEKLFFHSYPLDFSPLFIIVNFLELLKKCQDETSLSVYAHLAIVLPQNLQQILLAIMQEESHIQREGSRKCKERRDD
jgi:hypothetical protein